ncbi:hypothetical protein ACFYXC_38920 [Streptomyces sp. NPDC002701]|uniref:hypothetical protein n=1 Tax=Streptomyces sp. NPDC002701 TaxID=3364661 RepID=UPI0036764843
MKHYPPQFKADAVALYQSRPQATIRQVATTIPARAGSSEGGNSSGCVGRAWQHAAMVLRHPDGDYTITAMYSVPDDAWYLELDLVPKQQTLVTAIVPDEDRHGNPQCASTRTQGTLTSRTRSCAGSCTRSMKGSVPPVPGCG